MHHPPRNVILLKIALMMNNATSKQAGIIIHKMNSKVYNDVMSGCSDSNIHFSDLRNLLISYGFNERIKGDHFIY